jgi:hypothetical protein
VGSIGRSVPGRLPPAVLDPIVVLGVRLVLWPVIDPIGRVPDHGAVRARAIDPTRSMRLLLGQPLCGLRNPLRSLRKLLHSLGHRPSADRVLGLTVLGKLHPSHRERSLLRLHRPDRQ